MGNGEGSGPSDADGLQFDHAEFTAPAPAAVSCRVCQRPIADVYYNVNDAVLCEGCRASLDSHFQRGAGFTGFVKAVAFGLPAALAGAVIIYLVLAIAGISAGIVSILVGYMVGKAVRKASGDRGGLAFQLLAVFLTYSAVAWSYVPFGYQEMRKVGQRQQAEIAAKARLAPGAVGARNAAGNPPAVAPAKGPADWEKSPARRAIMMAVLIVTCYAIPFMMLPQGFITLLIIFFGLSQAWRLNRKVALTFHGPFRVGGGEGGPVLAGGAVHG